MKLWTVFTLFALSTSAIFAIDENHYKEEYAAQVRPLLERFQHGTFKGRMGVPIHYATYTSKPESERCLIILPGRTEPLEKYAEVIHTLDHGALAQEFTFFLMDHRGQGSSGRMLAGQKESEKGYVDEFEYYTLDVKTFLDTVVGAHHCREKLLLAHSMGAGIAVDFMQRYPEYIDRAALSSPMLKIKTAPYKYAVARGIVLASMALGRGAKYAAGQEAFDPTRDFANNTFTTSPVRYDMAMDMFDLFPQTRLGGVTNRWLHEIMKSTAKIRRNYGDIKIPLRVFHAGIESYSSSSEMVRLCQEAPYCNRFFLETSKHEVMMDRDINRNVVMQELEKFFK